ncbi:MAG TPA: phosphoribosylformylglycinamidine cyclo-ligase [Candidatus Nanoarchaeia archaeon]
MKRLTYKSAGVDVQAGDKASSEAFRQLSKTFNKNAVLVDHVVGLKADFKGLREPMLALAADGVGTKLKYASSLKENRAVGVDVVAMCVNDLARNNITPLGFALYRATGKINPKVMAEVVEGVVAGCLQAGCVYTTGETAEMPDFYEQGEYDLAGFAVGVFERNRLITGEKIQEGDVIFGLASSGVHSNGFSLIRKVLSPQTVKRNYKLRSQIIEPTKIYVKPVLEANQVFDIHGWAHITGGGIVGKLGKIIPDGLAAQVKKDSWPPLDIFQEMQTRGGVSDREMRNTFNMGLGMIGIASNKIIDKIINFLSGRGERVYVIGEIVKGRLSEKVVFK